MKERLKAWIKFTNGKCDEDTQLLIDDIKALKRQNAELREVLESYATMPDGEWLCKTDNVIYDRMWADAKEALAKYSGKTQFHVGDPIDYKQLCVYEKGEE